MKVSDVPVLGSGVIVVRRDGQEVGGELLAVDERTIWVRLGGREALEVPVSGVRVVRIPQHGGADAWALGGWTAAGALSTLSHGLLAVLTAPTWLLVGGTTTAIAAVGGPDIELRPDQGTQLRQYARYPQGMPGGGRPIEPVRSATDPPRTAVEEVDGGTAEGTDGIERGAHDAPPLDTGTLDAGTLDAGGPDGGSQP